ncbi:zinc ribbon domain-containing protein [Nocardia terpenica]|uniref:zinc ribbon domain-containing protein n=1 Tax=Nocardia terpenica TaxID=455432 RepID=UPI002FE0BC98
MRHGRVLHRVSRWLPSSKTCSSCGHVLESLALGVREWTCRECGMVHDRDYNAAENILAAGRAERINAGGAEVSPSRGEAHGDEAGSVRGARSSRTRVNGKLTCRAEALRDRNRSR